MKMPMVACIYCRTARSRRRDRRDTPPFSYRPSERLDLRDVSTAMSWSDRTARYEDHDFFFVRCGFHRWPAVRSGILVV